MNSSEFRVLLTTVAQAWNEADTKKALNCFTDDAIYMEPPDRHFFQKRTELEVLFDTLYPGNNMKWHSIWFDEKTQNGAGEYTFGMDQTHGVAVIEMEHGRIKLWREYQWYGAMSWEDFINHENKRFDCTVENFHPDGAVNR